MTAESFKASGRGELSDLKQAWPRGQGHWRWLSLVVTCCWVLGRGLAAGVGVPLVMWHSQPAKPGQTVLVYGDGLAEARVQVLRLKDLPPGLPGQPGMQSNPTPSAGTETVPIQPRERALKVLLPETAPQACSRCRWRLGSVDRPFW